MYIVESTGYRVAFKGHVLVIVSGEGSWETTDRVEMLSSVLGSIVAKCDA